MVRALAATRGAYLWMAGAGPYEDAIKSLAAQLGVLERIRFFGWQDDLNALLRAADIFVRSSRGEGLGNVLDAWANGLPAVASNCKDCSHLISQGETGLLVPKDDPEALALALNTAISNRELARRIGQAAKAYFRAQFSEERVVAMYLDLCRRLLEEQAWRMKPLSKPEGPTPRPAPA
jgi:glycosyltransferase involved in cell wall biosynthesis